MAIPDRLKPILDRATETFGGLVEIEKVLTQEQLAYILQFPGFIVIVKPWHPHFDLREYGFQTKTIYRVYDRNNSFLYEVYSSSGYYGEDPRDLEYMLKTSNGSYLHIAFDTANGPVCGMLWVCNQLSKNTIKAIVAKWEDTLNRLAPGLVVHEVFLDGTSLPTGTVKIYFLKSVRMRSSNIDEIKSDPSTEVAFHESGVVIPIYPRISGWYVFEFIPPVIRQDDNKLYTPYETLNNLNPIPLRPVLTNGIGDRRFRIADNGACFVELRNDFLGTTVPTSRSLVGSNTSYDWFNADEKIHLEIKLV